MVKELDKEGKTLKSFLKENSKISEEIEHAIRSKKKANPDNESENVDLDSSDKEIKVD